MLWKPLLYGILYIWRDEFCRHPRNWIAIDARALCLEWENSECFGGKSGKYEPHLLKWLEAGKSASPPLCVGWYCTLVHSRVGTCAVLGASDCPGQAVRWRICCFVKCFWNVGIQRNYRNANDSAISPPPPPAPSGGRRTHTHCAQSAVLCFQAICFIREVPVLRSVWIFFFFLISVN